jgi:hypothetical protein
MNQEFLNSGSMPDISQLNHIGNASIGTNVIFGDTRKRSIELIEEDWTSPTTDMSNGRTPQIQQGGPVDQRHTKRMRNGVGAN